MFILPKCVRANSPLGKLAMASLRAKGGLRANTSLEERWQAVHEASLATLRQVVARSQGSALEPAFLATLPSQALSGLRQAEAHAREELGATTALLLEQVATHEVLLEAMYDVHSVAMHDVSRLSPQQVGPRPRPPAPPAPPPVRRLRTRLASRTLRSCMAIQRCTLYSYTALCSHNLCHTPLAGLRPRCPRVGQLACRPVRRACHGAARIRGRAAAQAGQRAQPLP